MSEITMNLDTTTDEVPFTAEANTGLVTVYGTPGCMGCRATESTLKKKLGMVEGVDFIKVDLSEDAEALAMVKSLGYSEAPVVIAGDQHWGGFNRERLMALATA